MDTTAKLITQLDVEKRLQALAAKDRVRIKEFFLDFDKLRKGYCGEAAVSRVVRFVLIFLVTVPHRHRYS